MIEAGDPAASDEGIEVPYGDLSSDALRGLAEAFVLREGTDYGTESFSLEQKVAHVMAQLRRGDAVIVFNPRLASADIVLKREIRGARTSSCDHDTR